MADREKTTEERLAALEWRMNALKWVFGLWAIWLVALTLRVIP